MSLSLQTLNSSFSTDLHIAAAGDRPAERVIVCSPNSARRPELEAFIREGFRRQHGAVVRSFMPVLVGLETAAGRIVGAAGYRPAAGGRLYLEQYLEDPVENVIVRHHPGSLADRGAVAEIGNFAARDCNTALRLVAVVAEFLLDQRHRWAVFTATRTVRGIMRHLGIGIAEIGRADANRVAGVADQWGAYYETDPRVMLAFVPSWRGAADRTWSI